MVSFQSATIGELAKAKCAAQLELENATKGANNPHFKSKYADLATIIDEVRPVFAKHGIAITQSASAGKEDGGWVVNVETKLMHVSGEWEASVLTIPVAKADAQGIGSAITYGRRYGGSAMAFLAQEDDDGERAVGRGGGAAPRKLAKQDSSASVDEGIPKTLEMLKNAIEGAKTKSQLQDVAKIWSANAPDLWVQVAGDAKKKLATLS